MNLYILLAAMVVFGLLGGLVNAIKTNQEKKDYWKSLVKGIAAALLVPIFLEIMQSELVTIEKPESQGTTTLYDYLVFGGLCLIVAVFSDSFIDTIGNKLMKKVQKAEIKATESNKKVNTLINNMAEPDENEDSVEKRVRNIQEGLKFKGQVSDLDKVINSLKDNHQYKYRTINGIMKDTGLPKPNVTQMLKNLEKQGIVAQVKLDARKLWTIN